MQVVFLLRKGTTKDHKCCSFGKGTVENANAIPLKKEQQR